MTCLRLEKICIVAIYFIFGLLVSLKADDYVENIFDWTTFIDTSVTGVTPIPHAEHYSHDWESLYDSQYTNNKIIGLMLKNYTGPYDGTEAGALSTVMSYINTNGYYLNFVFADFESATEDENCEEMVDLIRQHPNAAINTAFIGNYNEYPGTIDYSNQWGSFNRSSRSSFYINSGMDLAMPDLYPYSVYRNHAVRSDIFGTNLCVSISHALFWAPLERYSTAKRSLPANHIIIPWIGGFILNSGYDAPVPSKAECRALLQHIRLRGIDGYYTYADGDNTNYTSRADYRDDMYANGWKPLDWFFDYPGKNEIQNLTTNKTGGVEWSGMRQGNRCLFLISNYTGNYTRIGLPNTIENIPDYSPYVAPGEHLLIDYVIGPFSYWKLDENTGVYSNDEADAGNDGGISGAAWNNGKFGSCLAFDGVDDEVSFGDVLDMGTSDRSISLWFKTTVNDSTHRTILSKGYSTTGNQHSIFMFNGRIYCIMDVSGTDRNINSGVVSDGEWHHLTLTIERNDQMKLYIDGALESSVDISDDVAIDAQGPYGFYLGRSNTGQFFNGAIDEVKIFSGVLSQQEVYDEYACTFISRLDKREGNIAYDDGALAENGTINGAVWGNGKFGSCLTFDGIDDGVSFGDVFDMGTGDRSISLWFKTTVNDSTHRTILSKGYSTTGNQHSIFMFNGRIYCIMDVSGTDRNINSGVVSDGEWHHLTLTIERNDQMKLYIDGALESSVDISDDVAIDAQDLYGFYLGRSNTGQFFNGAIDEVKMYNSALSSTQVQELNESYK